MTRSFARSVQRRYVLDANALVGLFEDRPGIAEKIERLLEQALERETPLYMSAVNWGEVFYVTWRRHGEDKAHAVEALLQEMPIVVIDVNRERASRAGTLKQKHGLGYADAFAAELSMERQAWLVTADPDFSKVGKALSLYPLPRHEK